MSPENDTPQNNDGTAVIADAAEAYFEYLERDGYRLEGCSSTEAAAFIAKALKSAGYELVNQVGTVHEFGVTKGLPGIGDALTRASAAQQRVVNAEQNLVEAYAGRAAAHAGEEAGKAFAAGLSRSDNNWLTRMLENTNTVCVQLPEPDGHCWYIDGTNDWLVHTGANGTGVFFETSVDLYEFAPDHAGNVAAALLAAKAKVEAGE